MVSIVKYGQEIDLSKIVAINGKKSLTLDNLVLNNTIKIKIPAGVKYVSELVEEDLKIEFKDAEGNILELILKDMSALLAQNDGFTLVEITSVLSNGTENLLASITDIVSATQAAAAGQQNTPTNANSDSGSTPNNSENSLLAQNNTDNAGITNARNTRGIQIATEAGNEDNNGIVFNRNTAPTIETIATQTVNEDNSIAITFNASDADNDVLTSSVTATNGTATVSGNVITYTPNQDYNGTDTITLTVNDGSATASQSFNVTVNPVNDKPKVEDVIISAVSEELGETVGTQVIHTGELSVTDVDISDSHVFTVVANSLSYSIVDENENPVPNTVIIDGLDVILNPITGLYTVEGDFDHLAVGETATITFSYAATDNSLDASSNISDAKVVTLRVTGTNDQPIVSDIDVNGTGTATIVNTVSGIVGTGRIEFLDDGTTYNAGDDTTSIDKWSFTHAGGPLTIDLLTEYSNVDIDNNGVNENIDSQVLLFQSVQGQWVQIAYNDDYSTDIATGGADGSTTGLDSYLGYSNLAAGEYMVAVGDLWFDASQALAGYQSDEYVYINGDYIYGYGPYQVTINGDISNVSVETVLGSSSIFETNATETIYTGILTLIEDLDTTDANHTFAVDSVSSTNSLVTDLSVMFTDENGGYKIDGNFDALADGETATITFDYTATDDSLATNATSITKTVTLTVTGTNDTPIISDYTEITNVSEDVLTGSISLEDVQKTDLDDTDSQEFVVLTNASTTVTDINNVGIGIITVSMDKNGNYTLSGAGIEKLGANDTAIVAFEVQVKDDSQTATNTSAPATITLTIDGSNDAATVSTASVDLVETNEILTASGTLTSTDVDNDDNKFIAQTVTGTNGSVAIDENGNWNYTASNTFDELAIVNGVPETLSEDFTVKSIDGTESTITINIEATNDAPIVLSETITPSINESDLDPADINLLESVVVDINATDFSFVISNSTIVSLFDTLNIESQIKSAISIALNNIPQEDIDLSITKVDGKITIDASIPDYSGPTPLSAIITQENLNIVLLDHLGSAFNLPFENAVYEGQITASDVDNDDLTLSLGDIRLEITSSNKYLTTLFEQLSGLSPELSLSYVQELASDLLSGATSSTLAEAKVIEVPATAVKLLQTAGLLSISLEDSGEYKVISPLFNTMKETDSIEISFDYTANDGIVDSNTGTTTFTIVGSNDAPTLIDKTVTVETEIEGNSYSGTLQGAYNLNMFNTVYENIGDARTVAEVIDQDELQQAILDNVLSDVNVTLDDAKIAEMKAELLPDAFASLGLTNDDIIAKLTTITTPINAKITTLQDQLTQFPIAVKTSVYTNLGALTVGSSEEQALDLAIAILMNDIQTEIATNGTANISTAINTIGTTFVNKLFTIYDSSVNLDNLNEIKADIADIQANPEALVVKAIVEAIETQIGDTSKTATLNGQVTQLLNDIAATPANQSALMETFGNSLFTTFNSSVTPSDLAAISLSITNIKASISTDPDVLLLKSNLISSIETIITTNLAAYPVVNPAVPLTALVEQFVNELESGNPSADNNLGMGLTQIYGPIILFVPEFGIMQNQIATGPFFPIYLADVQTELVSEIVGAIALQIDDSSKNATLTAQIIQLLSDIKTTPAHEVNLLETFGNSLFGTFNASVTPDDLEAINISAANIQSDPQALVVAAIVEAIEAEIGTGHTAGLTTLVDTLLTDIGNAGSDQTALLETFAQNLFDEYGASVTPDDLTAIKSDLLEDGGELGISILTFPSVLANTLIVEVLEVTDATTAQITEVETWVKTLISNASSPTFDQTAESKALLINTINLLNLNLEEVILDNLPADITAALASFEGSLNLDQATVLGNIDINQVLVDLDIDINNIDIQAILASAQSELTDYAKTLSLNDLKSNPDAISDTFKGILDTVFTILDTTIDDLVPVTDEQLKDAMIKALSTAIIDELNMDDLITALKANFGKTDENITLNIESLINPSIVVTPNDSGVAIALDGKSITIDASAYTLGDEITITVDGQDDQGASQSLEFNLIVIDDNGTLKVSDTPNYDNLSESIIESVVTELTQDITLSIDEIKEVLKVNIFTQVGLDTDLLDDDARDIIADKMVQDLYDRLGMDEDIQDLATLKYEISGTPTVVILDANDIVQTITSQTTVDIDPIYGTYTISNPEFENLDTTWRAEVSFEYIVTDGDLDSNTQTVNVTLDFADGTASDGHISGAKIFEDVNGDQIDNDDAAFTYTDENGDFNTNAFSGEHGLVLEGGTDISTGFAFESILTAPAGSSILSPITTLIDNLMKINKGTDTELDADEAKALVAKALGISSDIDLFTYDSYGIGKDDLSTPEEKTEAVAVQKVATQLMTIVSLGGASLAHGDNDKTEESASSDVFNAIAKKINETTDTNDVVELNDGDDVSDILTKAGVDVGSGNIKDSIVNTNTSMQESNSVDDLADIQEVIEQTEEEITLNGDVTEVLTKETLSQKVAALKPNSAPTIETIDSQVTNEEENILIDFNASDIDTTNTLTPSVSATNGTVEIINGKISFTPAKDFVGTAIVTLEVNDGRDTTSQSFEVTVNPINDAAIVSDDSKDLTETNDILTTSGTLTSTDIDNDDNSFTADIVDGRIGTLNIEENGNWNFTANSTFDNLNVGDTLSEDFTVTTIDGTESTITINIEGTNDIASISSTTENLTETNDVLTTSGTLTSLDIDNDDNSFIVEEISGENGTVIIESNGAWNFTANSKFDELNIGDTLSENFTVTTIDGTPTTITINIQGTNDIAIVSSATENLSETNDILTTSGTLTSTDDDNDDNSFTAEEISGENGTVIIEANGAWNFTANSTFDNLNVGDTLSEDFTVISIDGTQSTITINIQGTNDLPTVEVVSPDSILEDSTTATNISFTSTDIDSQTIIASVTAENGSAQADITNGVITYTPNADFTGTDTITLILDDQNGQTVSKEITITVDALPVLTISSATVNEGESATFTATLSKDSATDTVIEISIPNESADVDGSVQTITIPAGQTEIDFTINSLDDDTSEAIENFEVVATVISGDVKHDSTTSTLSVVDNDELSIYTENIVVNEEDGTATITVSLSTISEEVVSVDFQTVDGTATSDDYEGHNGTLTFQAGETSKEIQIALNNDSIYDTNESFEVVLSNPTNAVISQNTAIVNIKDADITATLTLDENVTADNVINNQESTSQVTISGSVSQYAQAGDSVTITVNNKEYFTEVTSGMTFSILVDGSDLFADEDKIIEAQVVAEDDITSIIASDSISYDVDVRSTGPASVTIQEDENNDGFINADELNGKVNVIVNTPADAQVDEILTVTNPDGSTTDYEITDNILINGLVLEYDAPAEGNALEVSATITDIAGNISQSGSNSAVLDTTPTSQAQVELSNIASGTINVAITLPENAQVGDTLFLNVYDISNEETFENNEYEITNDMLTNVFTLQLDSIPHSTTLSANASITDIAGNYSEISMESIFVNNAPLALPVSIDTEFNPQFDEVYGYLPGSQINALSEIYISSDPSDLQSNITYEVNASELSDIQKAAISSQVQGAILFELGIVEIDANSMPTIGSNATTFLSHIVTKFNAIEDDLINKILTDDYDGAAALILENISLVIEQSDLSSYISSHKLELFGVRDEPISIMNLLVEEFNLNIIEVAAANIPQDLALATATFQNSLLNIDESVALGDINIHNELFNLFFEAPMIISDTLEVTQFDILNTQIYNFLENLTPEVMQNQVALLEQLNTLLESIATVVTSETSAVYTDLVETLAELSVGFSAQINANIDAYIQTKVSEFTTALDTLVLAQYGVDIDNASMETQINAIIEPQIQDSSISFDLNISSEDFTNRYLTNLVELGDISTPESRMTIAQSFLTDLNIRATMDADLEDIQTLSYYLDEDVNAIANVVKDGEVQYSLNTEDFDIWVNYDGSYYVDSDYFYDLDPSYDVQVLFNYYIQDIFGARSESAPVTLTIDLVDNSSYINSELSDTTTEEGERTLVLDSNIAETNYVQALNIFVDGATAASTLEFADKTYEVQAATQPDNVVITYDGIVYTTGVEDNTFVAPTLTSTQTLFDFGFEDEGKYIEELTFNNGVINQNFYEEDETFSEDINLTDSDNNGNLEASGPWGKDELIFGDAKQVTNINGIDVSLLGLYQVDVTFKTIEIPTIDNVDEWWSENWIDTSSLQDLVSKLVDSNDYTAVYTDRENGYKLNIDGTIYDDNTENIVDGSWRTETIDSQTYLIIEIDDVLTIAYKEENGEIFKTEIGIPGVTEDMGTWYYGENLNVTSIQALLTQIESSSFEIPQYIDNAPTDYYFSIENEDFESNDIINQALENDITITNLEDEVNVITKVQTYDFEGRNDFTTATGDNTEVLTDDNDTIVLSDYSTAEYIDAKDGEDTLDLSDDQDSALDLASLLSNVSLYNIENIDTGANDATHILSNFTLDEFISLTDEDNTLKIFSDDDTDNIELDPSQNWTQAMINDTTPYQEDGFNVYYSYHEDQQLKLLIENTITVEVP